MVEKKEEKTEGKAPIELVEVPTQTGPAVKLPDETVVSIEQYFVWLGNQVYEIRKNLN